MHNKRKIIVIILVLLIVFGAGTLYYFSTKTNNKAVCNDVEIKINHKTQKTLINEIDIYSFLKINERKRYFLGKPLNKIDIKEIEYKLRKKPEIKNADVYFNISNQLVIEIEQRNPILRVINNEGKEYYICDDFTKINVSKHFSPYISPVSGNVNAKMDKIMYSLVMYVNNNSFWKDQIQQYFVNENYDISFIPTTGAHEVILGDIGNLDEKFKKLETFYLKGLKKTGWEKYKTINLKFKGQVICK